MSQIGHSDPSLPSGWTVNYTPEGRPYYLNHLTKSTQWHHPNQASPMNTNNSPTPTTGLPLYASGQYNSSATPHSGSQVVVSNGSQVVVSNGSQGMGMSIQQQDSSMVAVEGPVVEPDDETEEASVRFWHVSWWQKPHHVLGAMDLCCGFISLILGIVGLATFSIQAPQEGPSQTLLCSSVFVDAQDNTTEPNFCLMPGDLCFPTDGGIRSSGTQTSATQILNANFGLDIAVFFLEIYFTSWVVLPFIICPCLLCCVCWIGGKVVKIMRLIQDALKVDWICCIWNSVLWPVLFALLVTAIVASQDQDPEDYTVTQRVVFFRGNSTLTADVTACTLERGENDAVFQLTEPTGASNASIQPVEYPRQSPDLDTDYFESVQDELNGALIIGLPLFIVGTIGFALSAGLFIYDQRKKWKKAHS